MCGRLAALPARRFVSYMETHRSTYTIFTIRLIGVELKIFRDFGDRGIFFASPMHHDHADDQVLL